MKISALLVLLFGLIAHPAHAGDTPTNWGELTCGGYLSGLKELHRLNEKQAIQISESWLYGFVAGSRGITTMDPAVFKSFSLAVFDRCVQNKDAGLIATALEIPLTEPNIRTKQGESGGG